MHDAHRDRLNRMIAVSAAERTVADRRQADLLQQQKAARQRWAAAKGQLTRARKAGDADTIATAAQRADDAYRAFLAISDASIDEQQQILGTRLDTNGALLEQMDQTWDAGSAVITALAHPAPPGAVGNR
ncbi:hypothetical protein [Amycolatopsis saalfeldensis]|uniref:Uncharacterized protein n=1 Tax=Amycolatopsis saalfeldensis TaxID=394193 RepID=A0A1H8Y2G2_9PSEU|nr:hypothetical protein [Amycolatopsis saalfeldensis]SEP46484.1 hypothetical protein SAMN04489732_110266 [Amycolatopsis saalfeldensis]